MRLEKKIAIAEQYITEYIRNLPNANTDEATLQLDSEQVLRSIEHHHGLIVERAKRIYSFSHLTFHEYFTAREFVVVRQSSKEALQNLVSHITEKRWREVFLLAVGMSPSADRLLLLIKEKIDFIVADDQGLQEFIGWVRIKSLSVKFSYKPAVVRAFYLSLSRSLDLSLDPELKNLLQKLREQLPSRQDWQESQEWWLANGKDWREELREVMIRYRNIGYDWQFSNEQKELLQQYYDANKLLADCLNSDCYVSLEVRQQIEDTLLLPIAEIKQRQQQS